MEILLATGAGAIPGDTPVVVTYFSDDGAQSVEEQLGDLAVPGLDEARYRGETKGQLYRGDLFRGAPSVLLMGLGKRKDFSSIRFRRAVEGATRLLTRRGFEKLAIVVNPQVDSRLGARAAIDGVIRGQYDEGLLKTAERDGHEVDELLVVSSESADVDLERARVVAESANVARDLLNLPPSDLTPTILAERARQIGDDAGLKVQILDENEIADLGMGAILAVAAGSTQPPRVINLQYGDADAPTRLTFVGKGLTFDSGGLSLKPHESMEWMKGDMGGAAAVIGAMRAVGLLQPQGICVRGLIGSVENMPGPAAMKPGDVLRTLNGKTIEVLNTDAEGRLVLSDVLAYAVELGATKIVDLATLTGSAVVALGTEASALIGQPQEWVDQVKLAADEALERTWQLPLYPEFRRQIDSDLADMKNIGGREGGALTAAALLEEFVDDVPWAHLDIAGTAWIENKVPYAATGGTGYGVATLVQLAFNMAGGKQAQ